MKSGPRSYGFNASMARWRSSGVKSMRLSSVSPWRSKGGGFDGNGCVGNDRSPGADDCGTGRSSIGQTGVPVRRSRT